MLPTSRSVRLGVEVRVCSHSTGVTSKHARRHASGRRFGAALAAGDRHERGRSVSRGPASVPGCLARPVREAAAPDTADVVIETRVLGLKSLAAHHL
jgi:hypothetical protein